MEKLVNKKDLSVLITDDDESTRKILVAHLNGKYLCITAASAERGDPNTVSKPLQPGAD